MKNIPLLSLLCAATFSSCALQATSHDLCGSVCGQVRLDGHVPEDATVTIELRGLSAETAGQRPQSAGIDADGSFVFDNVRAGQYQLVATAPRSEQKTLVQDIMVRPGTTQAQPLTFSFREPAVGDGYGTLHDGDFFIRLTPGATQPVRPPLAIDAECKTEQEVALLRYEAGTHDAAFFEAGYGQAAPCLANCAHLSLSHGGTYTFYARAADGTNALRRIDVTNIDGEPPLPVQAVHAAYSGADGTLQVRWEPSPSDDVQLVTVRLSRPLGTGQDMSPAPEPQIVSAEHTLCAFTVPPDGTDYEVSVVAMDAAGNQSSPLTARATAQAMPAVYEARFERDRIAQGTGGHVLLTLRGVNLSHTDGQQFAVRLSPAQDAPSPVTVHDNGSASCSIPVPAGAGTYTAYVVHKQAELCTATLTVCPPPQVTAITLGTPAVQAGTQSRVTARLDGQSLDVCRGVSVTIQGSQGTLARVNAVVVSEGHCTAHLDVLAAEGQYTVSAQVDGTEQAATAPLTVYATMRVEQVAPVYAPLQDCGQEATVTLRGHNLNADMPLAVTVAGTQYPATERTATTATARVRIPTTARAAQYPIRVIAGGTEQQAAGTLFVQDMADFVQSQFALVTATGRTVTIGKATGTHLAAGTKIEPYAIGKYPVTQGLWHLVCQWAAQNGYAFSQDYAPRPPRSMLAQTGISWREAAVWCNALTEWHNAHGAPPALSCAYYADAACTEPLRQVPGEQRLLDKGGSADSPFVKKDATGYRLPTCAEWEYAFRGADESGAGWALAFSGSQQADDVAWHAGNSGGALHDCALKAPNALGLHDMSGTVWEWTADWAYTGVTRRLRGGSFASGAEYCMADSEGLGKFPYLAAGDWGFRVARSGL